MRYKLALAALLIAVPLALSGSASKPAQAFDFWGPVVSAVNEGPNESGEIPDGWIPWDVPVRPITPCDLGFGCDGGAILGDPDDPDMPGPDLGPGGMFVFVSYEEPADPCAGQQDAEGWC